MVNTTIRRFSTISDFHHYRGLPAPQHPLISVIDLSSVQHFSADEVSMVKDFYSIALKRNFNVKMKYGQQEYDFDEGIMFFMAPGQVFRLQVEKDSTVQQSGWMLLIHPDFLWNTALAASIQRYEYFTYAVHEALFLSDKEELALVSIIQQIAHELESGIDGFSQSIVISLLEVLFNYSDRFYHRQFITRKISCHQVLQQLERLLTDYFNNDELVQKGLPTVQYVADSLHMSPNYLSSMLKLLTGQTTQQHIHDRLIEKAKEKLSITSLTVSEIAYDLGFEHPQSFSKFFKIKTSYSPLQFRQSFN